MTPDSYLTLEGDSCGHYRDLGSRFLAFACPVRSEEDVKRRVEALRKEYFNATHHCFAYRLGPNGENWRAFDDGEPSSSAGRPILGQLLSANLTDCLIVVVRYFGGTKLGIPGLIKAYRTAAAEAIAAGKTVEKTACDRCRIEFGYERSGEVMKIVKEYGFEVISRQFGNDCHVELLIPRSRVSEISGRISIFANLINESI